MCRTICLFLITISLIGTSGCGFFDKSQAGGNANVGHVAIIDLDAVASRLGRDAEMANTIKQRENSLNQQLINVKNTFESQLGEKQKDFGEELSDEQTQQLAQMQQQANLQLNQIAQKAQANLNQHRAQVINRFREETKAVARKVAAEQGLSIVVTKNDNVIFTYNSAVDITNDVADRMLVVPPGSTQSVSPASPAKETHTASQPSDSKKR